LRSRSKRWGRRRKLVIRIGVGVLVSGIVTGRRDLAGRGRSQGSVGEERMVGVTLDEAEAFLLGGVLASALDVVRGAAARAHPGAGGDWQRGFVVVARGGGFAEDVREGELTAVAVGWGVGGEGRGRRFVGEGLRAGGVGCFLIVERGWEAVDVFFGFF
jgi:hypothetical protein